MVTMTIPVKRLVVRVRCPVPGPPRSESWHGSGSAGRPVGVGRCIGFAVVMAQVRRPVPFRTRKLRPGRGDGTALERVWESSTPPHSTYGPSGRAPSGFPEGPFFVSAHACFPPFGGGKRTPGGPWTGGSFQSLGVSGRWGIPGISGELPALIRWWNRLGNYALFRTQTLRRIEQNHVSRQSDGPAGRRPELA